MDASPVIEKCVERDTFQLFEKYGYLDSGLKVGGGIVAQLLVFEIVVYSGDRHCEGEYRRLCRPSS